MSTLPENTAEIEKGLTSFVKLLPFLSELSSNLIAKGLNELIELAAELDLGLILNG